VLAGFGALSLAALGLTAVTTTAQGAVTKQVVVSAAVDGGTATAGVVSTVNISIANASRIDDFHKFTIVLPPGISAPPGKTSPSALGISGGGNWSESVTTCGTVPNCSWLVVGKALLPRSTSKVRPGATLTASIGLVADAPGTLTFKVIHVEDDDFSVLGTPTITVVGGVAGAFCVTDRNPGKIVAGATKTFTVQAIAAGSFAVDASPCTGRYTAYVGTKPVRIHYTSDENPTTLTLINAVAPVISGDGTATPVGTSTSGADVTFNFSDSSTGQFTFTARFLTSAHNQSLQATEVSPGTVDGNSGGFDVDPGTATQISLTSVYDPTNPALGTALIVGAPFIATYYVSDDFNNVTTVGDGAVTGNVAGTGTFTQPLPSTGSTIDTEGVVSGSYNKTGGPLPFTLKLTSNGALSSPIPVTFADVVSIFTPGTSGTIQTSTFVANPGGVPTCDFGSTNSACVGVSLPQGASGSVALGFEDCSTSGANVGTCAPGTSGTSGNVVAHLTADLKKWDYTTTPATSVNLYGPTTPATLNYVCSATKCPWDTHDDEGAPYNAWEESVEAYNAFPLYAQDGSTPGAAFYRVPPCQDITGSTGAAFTAVPAVQKSCIDVTKLLRNLDSTIPSSYASLSFTILYWDDYKMVP
jgi:hypothetical protein